MTKYVFAFDDISNTTLEEESGKSANCAKLLQAYRRDGFEPAPNGFRIIGAAYRLHLESNNLITSLKEVLLAYESGSIPLNQAQLQCESIIMNAHMPPDVKQQIIAANKVMEEQYGVTFMRIPRSDFTIGEDQEGEAGAGRHSSFPGITNQSDLLFHVKKVWASAFSDKAIAAFKNRRNDNGGLLHLDGDMRVPVLREVNSKNGGSFIVFTNTFGIAYVTYLHRSHGEDLVSGSSTPAIIVVSLNLLDRKEINPIISFDIPTPNLGLSHSELVDYLLRIKRRHDITGPIDNEAAKDDLIYTVQERPNTPHLNKIKSNKILIHTIPSFPNNGLIGNGVSVSDLCANGKVLNLTHDMLHHLDAQNFSGKILIFDEAAPELSILASMPQSSRPNGLITRQGTSLCHMAINIDDNIPCIVGVTNLTQIGEGEEISILGNKVYHGNHPFIVDYLDLNELPKLEGETKARLVACNPSKVDKYHILPHQGYALVRHEGLQQAIIVNGEPLPPILSCLHWDKVSNSDLSTSLINLMRVPEDLEFSFGSPIEAYIYYFSRALIPLLEDARLKDCDLDLRAYGGRLVEDNPKLQKGFIPSEAYDSIGCDGGLMYLQPWGKGVLETYCKIWLEIWNMGYKNMPIFIPNISNLKEWLIIKEIIVSCGIPIDRKQRFGEYKVKIMLETTSSLFLTQQFYEAGVDEGSLGFNDLRQSFFLFKRDFAFIKTRGNTDSDEFLALINMLFDTKPDEFKIHTCGVPSPKLIELLIRRGVDSIGLAPGKKFFEGVKLMHQIMSH